ncbi:hypothetical protein EPUS_02801 [Endocarpon pusillum Z07020]|uniref:Uncharacterized protein n=1 Tax=Endocarpon pusillum (strain Z07020 / HMAS-L-300199) TaxID=1263415 RepID=U1HQ28_ENDPU|nr:uncharacterized protein EPUS_02801 [Endocarpon pusillum Z07020]ERF72520.1 hypothetical protein EPUS_02801 [Endocarpon pusillum Z07020]
MSTSAFLNPIKEVVDDSNEEILDSIVEGYSEGNRAQETDEESVEDIPIRSEEAMQAIQLLQRYEEQQDDGSSGAWAVTGPLQQEWNNVLPTITETSDQLNFREQLFRKDQGNCVIALPKWSFDINVARRAYKAFEDLKEGSLGTLLRAYKFYYAEYTIRPRGLRVIISSPDESVSAAGTTWTHSKIGGCLEINGKYYGLTAAHAFPDIATRAVASSHEENDRSSSSTSKIGAGILELREVYAHAGIVENLYDNALLTSAQSPDTRMLLNGTIKDPERASVAPILYNRNKDWALVPISNRRFATHNWVDLGSEQYMSVSGVAETLPEESVFCASGVSQPSVTKLSGTASAILLPGSDRLQIVWTAERGSDLGDCGSWVINKEGRPFGMIVAASGDAAEGEVKSYCLPLAPIFADIQEDFNAPIVEPAARDPEAEDPNRFSLETHPLWDLKFDVREDARESSNDSTSSGSTESNIDKIRKVEGYGTDSFRASQSTRSTINVTQAQEEVEKALRPQELSDTTRSNERQPKKPVRSHTVEIEDGEEPKPSNKTLENGDILSTVSDESRTSEYVESPAAAVNAPNLGRPKASDVHVEQDPEDEASDPQDCLTTDETQLTPRTRTSDLMDAARPTQGNRDHERASSGPVVLAHVSRRLKSPSPELEEKLEQEGIIVRQDEAESPLYREDLDKGKKQSLARLNQSVLRIEEDIDEQTT